MKTCSSPSYTHISGRIFAAMTPARTASHGLVIPPPLQHWLHVVLMLFAELVSHAVSTLQMVFVRRTHDWHTKAAPEDLPRATTGIHNKEQHSGPPGSLTQKSRRRRRLEGPAVDAQRRDHTRCASPFRHDAAHRATSPGSAGGGHVLPRRRRGRWIAASARRAGGGCSNAFTLSCHSRRSAQARRAGTQARQAQASAHATSGFRLTRSARVRNDSRGVFGKAPTLSLT